MLLAGAPAGVRDEVRVEEQAVTWELCTAIKIKHNKYKNSIRYFMERGLC